MSKMIALIVFILITHVVHCYDFDPDEQPINNGQHFESVL